MNELDISDLKQQGKALQVAILNAVKDSQGLASPYPDQITMTKSQFKDLSKDTDVAYFQSDDKQHIYITPLNAMEVRIK